MNVPIFIPFCQFHSESNINHPHLIRPIPNARTPPPVRIILHPIHHHQQPHLQLHPRHIEPRRIVRRNLRTRARKTVHRRTTTGRDARLAFRGRLRIHLAFDLLDGGS